MVEEEERVDREALAALEAHRAQGKEAAVRAVVLLLVHLRPAKAPQRPQLADLQSKALAYSPHTVEVDTMAAEPQHHIAQALPHL